MRKIEVLVRPNARRASLEITPSGSFMVSVTEPPLNGRANAAVERAIAEYFKIPQSLVLTLQGKTGRRKILGLPD